MASTAHPSNEIFQAIVRRDDLPKQIKADAIAHIKVCPDCVSMKELLMDIYDNREADREARRTYGDV